MSTALTQTADTNVFATPSSFEHAQRVAKALCSSSLVPKHFQGEDRLADCLIALEMANRIGASPMAVLQNLYVVHGSPGWSSKFLIATFNASGRYEPIRYHFDGEDEHYGCYAYTAPRGRPDERIEGPRVTRATVKSEGWIKNPKWKPDSLEDLMFRYRAAAFLIRTTAPEIALGLLTQEELMDSGPIDMGKADRVDAASELTAAIINQDVTKLPEVGTETGDGVLSADDGFELDGEAGGGAAVV